MNQNKPVKNKPVKTMTTQIVNISSFVDENENDDDLISLSTIYNQVKSKITIPSGKIGQYLRPGQINASEAYVTPKVQREISTRQINTYGQFNRSYARPLIIAVRPNGKNIVVDGQHTTLMEMASGEHEPLPCLFLDHPSDRNIDECIREEANIYFALNGNRKDPSHVDKMKAGYAFDLPEAVEYNNNLVDCGVYIEGYDYLGDPDGIPMDGEYQWRMAVKKFGAVTVAKACKKLGELQKNKNWAIDKKNKPVTSIRADMVMMLSTLYDFMKRAKMDGKMNGKYESIDKFINTGLTQKIRETWYKGISGASTGIIGALRIINAHNETAGSVVIGPTLLATYGLIDPTK